MLSEKFSVLASVENNVITDSSWSFEACHSNFFLDVSFKYNMRLHQLATLPVGFLDSVRWPSAKVVLVKLCDSTNTSKLFP